MVTDRPLRPADLAPIPRDSTVALAFRLDLQRTMDFLQTTAEKSGPEGRETFDQAIEGIEKSFGFDLRHGVLRSFGDTWCIYNSPGEGGFVFTGLTGVVNVQKDAPLRLISSRLRCSAQNWLKNPLDFTGSDDSNSTIEHFTFAGHEVGCTNFVNFAPAWCLTDEQLIMALSPQNVKAYLSRDARYRPINQLPQVAALFTKDEAPILVAYGDSPKLFEICYPAFMLFIGPAIDNAFRQTMKEAAHDERESKVDLDLSLLPSAPAIGRHLRPTIFWIRRRKYGVEFDIRGTIPMGGPLELPFLMESMGIFPSLLVHPVQRTEEVKTFAQPQQPSFYKPRNYLSEPVSPTQEFPNGTVIGPGYGRIDGAAIGETRPQSSPTPSASYSSPSAVGPTPEPDRGQLSEARSGIPKIPIIGKVPKICRKFLAEITLKELALPRRHQPI